MLIYFTSLITSSLRIVGFTPFSSLKSLINLIKLAAVIWSTVFSFSSKVVRAIAKGFLTAFSFM